MGSSTIITTLARLGHTYAFKYLTLIEEEAQVAAPSCWSVDSRKVVLLVV